MFVIIAAIRWNQYMGCTGSGEVGLVSCTPRRKRRRVIAPKLLHLDRQFFGAGSEPHSGAMTRRRCGVNRKKRRCERGISKHFSLKALSFSPYAIAVKCLNVAGE